MPPTMESQAIGHDLDEEGLTTRARALGSLLVGGEVLLLEGPMGAGKTTFTRALAEGMGALRPERVTSPTFALCLVHPGQPTLVHLDLYRLDGDPGALDPGGPAGAAAESLGLESDELVGPDRVVVVEWPDRWASPPTDHLRIIIDRPQGILSRRSLRAVAGGPRSAELLGRWIASNPA